ncbi:MAG: hypothetical protein AAFO79_09445 [Pseudomonadota bacterium]
MTSTASSTTARRTLRAAKFAIVTAGLALASTATAQAADYDSPYADYSCVELAEERDVILSRHSGASSRVIRALREIRYFENRNRCSVRIKRRYSDYTPTRYRTSPYDKYVRMCPRTGRPLW